MGLNNMNSCSECQNQAPCPPICTGCPVLISSDCVNNFTEDLVYSGIIKGQTLTEVFVQFDEYINTRFGASADYISLINIGTGSQIYKGISSVGKKQIRSLLGSSLVNVTQGTDDIIISANTEILGTFVRSNQNTYSLNNIGVGASVYKNTTLSLNNIQFNLKKLKSSDNSVTITEGADDINFSVVGAAAPDGSETKLTASTNISITGSGTIASPYIISSTDTNTTYSAGTGILLTGNTFSNSLPDQIVSITGGGATTVSGTYPNFSISTTAPDGSETKLTAGSNITVSGSGTIASPYTISAASGSVPDGSETKLTASTNIAITGSGTVASPYTISATDTNTTYSAGAGLILSGTVFNLDNLQKVLTYPADFTGTNYTLVDGDNNYEIIVNNGATAVTITVPSGLTGKFGAGFTQEGSADVTYVQSGTTINNPTGLKIKGQFYQIYLSQKGTTNIFFLGGNTKL